jgi:hypothetical protein
MALVILGAIAGFILGVAVILSTTSIEYRFSREQLAYRYPRWVYFCRIDDGSRLVRYWRLED